MKIQEFDTVLLKDGRKGDIMDVSECGTSFIIDITLGGDEWETEGITLDDIEKVLHHAGE